MNAKATIRKILFVAVWAAIGGSMLTLLLAAISSKKKGLCRNYKIELKAQGSSTYFVREKDIEEMLNVAGLGAIRGTPVAAFRLHELERMLEANEWVSNAELYFDNHDVLHITVSQNTPAARVFSVGGSSFYIDQTGHRMPLSGQVTARVPVFTGFAAKQTMTKKDSAMLRQIAYTAGFIQSHPFWAAQVAQVHITESGKMEMVPLVGAHVVKLGDAENLEEKFRKLFVFYRQVMKKTGFDYYRVIDVQYKGQVLASRNQGDARIDSVTLKRNVEKLLLQATEASVDSVPQQHGATRPVTALPGGMTDNNRQDKTDTGNIKTGKPAAQPKEQVQKMPQKPKAVMPAKKNEEENQGYR